MANGLAILNNERFLEKCELVGVAGLPGNGIDGACSSGLLHVGCCPSLQLAAAPLPRLPADGWGFSNLGNNPMGPSPNALKYQVIGMLHAAAYLRGGLRGGRQQYKWLVLSPAGDGRVNRQARWGRPHAQGLVKLASTSTYLLILQPAH